MSVNIFDFFRYQCRELRRTLIEGGTAPELAEQIATDLARATGKVMQDLNYHGPAIDELSDGKYDT